MTDDSRERPEPEDAYDRIDRLNQPRGLMSTLARPGRRRNVGVMTPVVVVFAVAIAAAFFSNSGSAKVPSCKAGSVSCEQTSDGLWVPRWYYGGLALAQGTSGATKPSTTGAQPSTAELEQSGATSSDVVEAESDAQSSAAEESSGGSGDPSSEDSGGDVGGGDAGGGDEG